MRPVAKMLLVILVLASDIVQAQISQHSQYSPNSVAGAVSDPHTKSGLNLYHVKEQGVWGCADRLITAEFRNAIKHPYLLNQTEFSNLAKEGGCLPWSPEVSFEILGFETFVVPAGTQKVARGRLWIPNGGPYEYFYLMEDEIEKTQAAPNADITERIKKKTHYYIDQQGDVFGYDAGITNENKSAGKTEVRLAKISYLGLRDGRYLLLELPIFESEQDIYSCQSPCGPDATFKKITVRNKGREKVVTRVSTLRMQGSILWSMFEDAKNGALKVHPFPALSTEGCASSLNDDSIRTCDK